MICKYWPIISRAIALSLIHCFGFVRTENIYFSLPGAKRVLELASYEGEQGKALFQKSFGHSDNYSLGEALWVCTNLFSVVRFKMSHKRIMLFTNEDDPHGQDSAKTKFARTKAADLRETG